MIATITPRELLIRLPKARCAILALLSVMVPFIAQGQTAPPASAPENWGPISINLEEIDLSLIHI